MSKDRTIHWEKKNRAGYTWIETMVVVSALGLCMLLLIPAIQAAREASRRLQCADNLKLIAIAIQGYSQANRVFPPGTICTTAPSSPSKQYDVWGEAARTEPGYYGTGLLCRISPFWETNRKWPTWDRSRGISNSSTNLAAATTNIAEFYCPSRRAGLRKGDNIIMLSKSWTGGGTDYGGCVGRYAAFTLETGYNLCDGTMQYHPAFRPEIDGKPGDDNPAATLGVFGRVNIGTRPAEIRDGLSNTIMIGELQRINHMQPTSKDGWAIGGPATLFTTGAMFGFNGAMPVNVDAPTEGSLVNNGFWGSPGSDHPGGINFGMADGTVKFMADMNPNLFTLMGSMNDRPYASSGD